MDKCDQCGASAAETQLLPFGICVECARQMWERKKTTDDQVFRQADMRAYINSDLLHPLQKHEKIERMAWEIYKDKSDKYGYGDLNKTWKDLFDIAWDGAEMFCYFAKEKENV